MAGKRTTTDSGNIELADHGPIDVGGESGEPVNDSGAIDPASLAGTDDGFERDGDGNLIIGASGKPRRKRGRKPNGAIAGSSGSATKSSARNTQNLGIGLETLSNSLLIVHVGIAALTDFKKWELEKKESDALAASIAHVMEQFDMTPDPRFAAIAGLVTTAGMIYGPRVYLYREQQAIKRKQKAVEKSTPANEGQFNPANLGGFNLGG